MKCDFNYDCVKCKYNLMNIRGYVYKENVGYNIIFPNNNVFTGYIDYIRWMGRDNSAVAICEVIKYE